MLTTQMLHLDQIVIDSEQTSKKHVLELISKLLSNIITNSNYKELFKLFIARENLGNTTVAKGVVIPHICYDDISNLYAVFIRLKQGINFSDDNLSPVDLILALAIPSKNREKYFDFLRNELIQNLNDEKLCEKLRQAPDKITIYQLLTKNY